MLGGLEREEFIMILSLCFDKCLCLSISCSNSSTLLGPGLLRVVWRFVADALGDVVDGRWLHVLNGADG